MILRNSVIHTINAATDKLEKQAEGKYASAIVVHDQMAQLRLELGQLQSKHNGLIAEAEMALEAACSLRQSLPQVK